jgi:hypothetical protein
VWCHRPTVLSRPDDDVCSYLVAAHLVSKGKNESQASKWQGQLEQLRKIIINEEYQYSDPITDFVKAVYCDYDFERAQVPAFTPPPSPLYLLCVQRNLALQGLADVTAALSTPKLPCCARLAPPHSPPFGKPSLSHPVV